MSGELQPIKWKDLPVVYVKLPKDEIGYPPKDWEELKAEPTETAGIYRLKSIPVYARGLAFNDEVHVGESSEGYSQVVDSVVRRNGFSTMRLLIEEDEDKEAL